MTQKEFTAFVTTHLSRVEPLMREVRLAYWNATISGRKEDFTRYAELDVAYKSIYSDPYEFATLKTWRAGESLTDPLDRRQIEVLYRAYLRHQLPRELIEQITTLSSGIANKFNIYRATLDGETLTSNQIRQILREGTDSDHRRRAWEAEKAVGKVVKDDLLELVALRNKAASTLGYGNYYEMSLSLDEQNDHDLIALFDELDAQTRGPFREMKLEVDEILSARFGVPAEELRPWHYSDPFFQEAPQVFDLNIDKYYENVDILSLVSEFFAGIGFDAGGILERSDLHEKPGKEQHAYCLDIDRKGDIRILANVRNDEMWTGTMLHELGHALYDRHIDPETPFVIRQHAHLFITEAIAMLFGRLSKDADWIQQSVGMTDSEKASIATAIRKSQRLSQLIFCRWCQVMVRFERALYADPGQDLNGLWWNLVERYQMLPPPAGRDEPDWASKIHVVAHPVYYHNYMLGELFASQLDRFIQRRVLENPKERMPLNGRPEVGEYLKENIFAHGKRYCWEDLVRRATGEALTPSYFVEQYVL